MSDPTHFPVSPYRSSRPWRQALGLLTALWLGGALAQALPETVSAQPLALRFQDFFTTAAQPGAPVTLGAALRQADGRSVHLTGYMVQQERPPLGRFMLTPRPVRMSEHADGDADDLPLSWVMVYLDPSQQDFAVPHVRGPIALSGVLHVGRMEEEDGRVSWVRLQLAPEATRSMSSVEFSQYLHSQEHIH